MNAVRWTLILAFLLCSACTEPVGPAPQTAASSGVAAAGAGLVPAQADEIFVEYVSSAARGWQYCAAPMAEGVSIALRMDVGSGNAGDVASAADITYSTTNLQEVSVDEADRVKFDGEFLYVAEKGWSNSPSPPFVRFPAAGPDLAAEPTPEAAYLPEIEIVPPDPPVIRVLAAGEEPPRAEPVARIELLERVTHVDGMYLLPHHRAGEEDWLAIVASALEPVPVGRMLRGRTVLQLVDVSNPAAPTTESTLELDGDLVASRRIGDRLYLVTQHLPAPRQPIPCRPDGVATAVSAWDEPADAADVLPWISVDGGEPEQLVDIEHCFVPDALRAAEWPVPHVTTVTAIDLRDPSDRVSVCVAGFASQIYASASALYLTHADARFRALYAEQAERIHKFAFAPEGPSYRGTGIVPGTLAWNTGSFALGEHDGVLGVVTRGLEGYRLTLLRESADGERSLEELAHLPNEAEPAPIGKPGEQLHSVRFMGERVYAVTFRQIDPLYIIDRSDPERPYIAGEVEVPGFSDYLHPIGANLLLGVGKDVIVESGMAWYQGIKLELFDVSDPRTLASIDSLVVGMRGSQSAALSDHHAVAYLAASAAPHRTAVPIAVHEGPPGAASLFQPWSHTGLHLFEIDENETAPALSSLRDVGALVRAEAGVESDQQAPSSTEGDRAVIQGGAVHYIHGDAVWSARWRSPETFIGPQ